TAGFGEPQGAVAQPVLPEHELHFLPDLQLGIPVSRSRAALFGARERLAVGGAGARGRRRRGCRRRADGPGVRALRLEAWNAPGPADRMADGRRLAVDGRGGG